MFEKIPLLIYENHLGEYASVLGLLVTVIGFAITIWNVRRSKKAAELAEEAVSTVRRDIILYQTVDGFSNAINTMEEIKRLHRQSQWLLLPDRYSSVRRSLITIKVQNPLLSDGDKKNIQSGIALFKTLDNQLEKRLEAGDSKGFEVARYNSSISSQIDKIHESLVMLNSEIGIQK